MDCPSVKLLLAPAGRPSIAVGKPPGVSDNWFDPGFKGAVTVMRDREPAMSFSRMVSVGCEKRPSRWLLAGVASLVLGVGGVSCFQRAAEVEEIRKLFHALPADYREVKDLEKMTADVKACRDRAESFLARSKGAEGEEEAQYILARLLLNLHRRAWSEYATAETKNGQSDVAKRYQGWSQKYFARIIELGEAALAKARSGSSLRSDCLSLLGDALLQGGKAGPGLARYETLLKEFPDFKERANTYLAMASSYQELGRFQEGVALMRKALKEFPEDSHYPYFYEWLWKLHSGEGDLTSLLKLVEEMRGVLPKRAQKEGIGKSEKEACERLVAYSGFRLGYSRFALGDFTGSIQCFREALAYLESLEKQRGSIPDDFKVYRDIRIKDNLEVLETRIGKPVPMDLRQVLWAGGKKPALDGRPIAILFRNYGEERSAPFLKALDLRQREKPDAFELVTISFLKGPDNPRGQSEEILKEAQALEVTCPVGLDPDAQGKALFHAFKAPVGSACFVIVDRTGNYVWFQQDPKQIDARFSLAVLDRVVASR
jgi:tetratricopeptide (TPR) repeat protein